MSLGVVVQDSTGEVQAAMSQIIHFITDPAVAESMAVWKAFSFCLDLGLTQVLVEGDSLIVMYALCHSQPDSSSYGSIIEATQAQLQRFSYHEVQHVRRSANTIAHQLARVALKQSLVKVWVGVCPPFILDFVRCEKL
jgi:ribonuclease HI